MELGFAETQGREFGWHLRQKPGIEMQQRTAPLGRFTVSLESSL